MLSHLPPCNGPFGLHGDARLAHMSPASVQQHSQSHTNFHSFALSQSHGHTNHGFLRFKSEPGKGPTQHKLLKASIPVLEVIIGNSSANRPVLKTSNRGKESFLHLLPSPVCVFITLPGVRFRSKPLPFWLHSFYFVQHLRNISYLCPQSAEENLSRNSRICPQLTSHETRTVRS